MILWVEDFKISKSLQYTRPKFSYNNFLYSSIMRSDFMAVLLVGGLAAAMYPNRTEIEGLEPWRRNAAPMQHLLRRGKFLPLKIGVEVES
jgi:hypothetical protein